MPAFVILDITINDPELMEEYKKIASPSVIAFDGTFVVRGGQTISLEGDWNPKRMVILQFPTMERAQEWYYSDAYTEAKAIREKAAITKMIMLEGV